MHAFWLALTYDLLEDRHIDDVIIKNFKILYYIKQIDSDTRQLGIYLLIRELLLLLLFFSLVFRIWNG